MRIVLVIGAWLTGLAACSSQQLLNTFTPERGYGLKTGVAFDESRNLALDLYVPHGADHAPVVLFLYGGRWQEGKRGDYTFAGQALASRGLLAVLPDYRKYPAVRFPLFVQDAARAVAWTREHAARFGGDPERIFVMGHSAGAHIAALLALDGRYLAEVGGSRDWLRGMIGLAGPYDFMPITAADLRDLFGPPERFIESQPVNFADGRHPPLLLLHGRNDKTVWMNNTVNLAAAVAAAGGTAETVLYDDLSHAWILATLAAPLRGQADVLDQVADFVQRWSTEVPNAPAIRTGTTRP